MLPVGGGEGRQLVDMLTEAGVDFVAVPVRASARCNIAVVEPDGTVTKINSTGRVVLGPNWTPCCAAVQADAYRADWIVAGGSLPAGVPDTCYADLLDRLRPTCVPVAVDTSGPALLAAIKAFPALIKPNREELETAVGGRVRPVGEVVEPRHRNCAAPVPAPCWPASARDGAVLVDGSGRWYGEAPAVARSAVGAGDAMLAGFLYGGASGPAALAVALAWGAAAASLPGSTLPGPRDVRTDVVSVHERIDAGRRLSDID